MATWTQADVDALKIAVGSGVLIVEYEGPPRRKVQYQSLDMMRSLLAAMLQDLAAAAGKPKYRLVATTKGF